ncbi:hypothetical protein IWW38_005521, partial [Coemansia aciculifera]
SEKSRSIESEFADTRQTHNAAAVELDALRKREAAMEAQRNELQAKLVAAESAAAAELGALQQAQRTAQELQARLDENEAMRDEYQQRITTQSQEYEELKDKYDHDAVARVTELEDAHRVAVAERDDLRGAYGELEAQCSNLEKARTRLTAELEDARLANEREGSHALELEQANAEFKAQYDVLTAEVAEAQAKAKELQTQLEAEAASHGVAQEVKARIEAQHKAMQDKLLAEVTAKEAQHTAMQEKLLAEVADLGKRLDAETSEREKAEQARADADAELQKVRLSADSSEKSRQTMLATSSRLVQAEADAEALRRAVDDYKALADRHERKAGAQLETITARDLELAQIGRKLQRVERRLEEVMAQAAYHLDARNRLDSENVELREKLEEAYRQQGEISGLGSAMAQADSTALVRRAEAQAAERVHAAKESRLALTQALHAAQRE